MIRHPKPGQQVQIWYAKRSRNDMPHHAKVGLVEAVGRGKIKNAGVRLGGELVVVPRGNLRPPL